MSLSQDMVITNKWEMNRDALLEAINNFDQSGKVIQDERNTVKVIDIAGEKLNFKRFKKPNAINAIAYRYLRLSKAKRSYLYALRLQEKGIGTPEPVAFIEYKDGLGFGSSFYISRQSDYDFTFREIKNQNFKHDATAVLISFTQFLFKMHEKGVLFLDNSPGNTLITQVTKGFKFEIVDLNRMKFKTLTYDERLKNFERLTTQKWMYEIMAKEYARLSNHNPELTFDKMYGYMQKFQEKFMRRRKFKKWRRSLFK